MITVTQSAIEVNITAEQNNVSVLLQPVLLTNNLTLESYHPHPPVETAVPIGAVFTDTTYPNHPHPKVETAVPIGAVFTDTVYNDANVVKAPLGVLPALDASNLTGIAEEKIYGKVIKTIQPLGTYNLDFSLGSFWDITKTGDVTLGIINPPPVTTSVSKNITSRSDTATELLFVPASWKVIGTYNSDGTDNLMTLVYSNVDGVIEIRLYINVETV